MMPVSELQESTRLAGEPAEPIAPVASANDARLLKRLRRGFLVTAVALGGLQYWAHRHTIYPDGLSYLEIAQAYLAGDWANAINAYWSPLYSWILALALWLLRPGAYWEFAVVHGVDFALYVCAVVAFDFFLRRFAAEQGSPGPAPAAWVWRLFGYCLFLWAMIALPLPAATTPDILVAALSFWAAGLLVRVGDAGASVWRHGLLGLALGLGYLAKAAMLPIAAAVLAAMLWMARRSRERLGLGAVAVATFALVVTPFAVALSLTKGRITFGDAGALNYAWYVNRVPGMHVHWQGDSERVAAHPTRLISESPRIFEYAEPVAGTYPPWYDPSYWNEGLTPRFDLVQQLQAVYEGLQVYWDLLLPFVVVFLGLAYALGPIRTVRALRHNGIITLFGAASLLLYLLVRVEPRFIMASLPLLFLGSFGALRAQRWASPRVLDGMLLALGAVALAAVVPVSVESLQKAVHGEGHVSWEVAEAVRAAGVREGERIAVVGRGTHAYWAHLARVKIVAEVEQSDQDLFWSDADAQRRALQRLREVGARAVIGVPPRRDGTLGEWQPLTAGYALLRLDGHEGLQEAP